MMVRTILLLAFLYQSEAVRGIMLQLRCFLLKFSLFWQFLFQLLIAILLTHVMNFKIYQSKCVLIA